MRVDGTISWNSKQLLLLLLSSSPPPPLSQQMQQFIYAEIGTHGGKKTDESQLRFPPDVEWCIVLLGARLESHLSTTTAR